MKCLLTLLLLCGSLYGKAQNPVASPPQQVPELNHVQFKKNYKAATIVELSGVMIAFVGSNVNEDIAGKSAFAVFGSSIALGGLFYSLFASSERSARIEQLNKRRLQFEPSRQGVGVKMKF